jgi:hypothetical protein
VQVIKSREFVNKMSDTAAAAAAATEAEIKAQSQLLSDIHFAKYMDLCRDPIWYSNEAYRLMKAPQIILQTYENSLKAGNPMTDEKLLQELAAVCDYVTDKMLHEAPAPLRKAFMDKLLGVIDASGAFILGEESKFHSGCVANIAAVCVEYEDKEKVMETWTKFMVYVRSKLPLPF